MIKPKQLAIVAIGLFASADLEAAAKPNVLWVLTDDQRYDSIQAFNRMLHGRDHSELGYVESPNVDRLAASGTTFISTYCQAPGCAPSRASMHYGRYPFRSGVYEFEYHNNNAEHCRPTLPEAMAEQGYQTLHIGKLGVRLRTVKNGRAQKHAIYQTDIDSKFLAAEGLAEWGKNWIFKLDGKKLSEPLKNIEFFIAPDGTVEYSNPVMESVPGYEGQSKRVDEKYDIFRHFNAGQSRVPGAGMAIGGVSPRAAGKTRDGYYSSVFVDYLNNADQAFQVGSKSFDGVDTSKPLFCHIGYDFPHTPVLPPQDYRERFQKHRYQMPAFEEAELETMPKQLMKQRNSKRSDHFTDEQKQSMTQDYYAFCAYGDSLIGQSVEAFVEYSEGQSQPWIVVYVCGDHGWKLNDHGAISKFTPWEVDTHNPIVVVSSDKEAFPPGKVVTDFTEFVDIAPTILSAGGADLGSSEYNHLDGRDLARVASGESTVRDFVIGESHAVTGPRAFIRTKEYTFSLQSRPDKRRGKKMDWALKASYEELDPALYHTPSDPHEVNNLAFDEKHAAVAKKLKSKLLDIVLGDGRIEVAWGPKADGTQVFRSNFAPGAREEKLTP